MDEWVLMVSKRLVSRLQIYDTGKQEAWLHWLLLKEFGNEVTYPISKGMLWFEALHDTHMIWQKNIWPSVYLDPYGFNKVIDEWYSYGDL